MKSNNHIQKGNIKENITNIDDKHDYYNWIDQTRQNFYRLIWEYASVKREPVRLFFKPDHEYGISYENSIFVYKVIPDMSVFGHYKAYKKELTQQVFIKAIKRAERFINEGENTILTTVKNLNRKPVKKTKSQKNFQYHLFDLEPYTVIKARSKNPGYIEPEAKEHIKGLAHEIWYWKQRVEKDNKNKFIKAFSFAFYSDKNIKTNSYIQFDDNGRLKRGCKKYWNFLKKEVSKISNIPIKELII